MHVGHERCPNAHQWVILTATAKNERAVHVQLAFCDTRTIGRWIHTKSAETHVAVCAGLAGAVSCQAHLLVLDWLSGGYCTCHRPINDTMGSPEWRAKVDEVYASMSGKEGARWARPEAPILHDLADEKGEPHVFFHNTNYRISRKYINVEKVKASHKAHCSHYFNIKRMW